MGSAGSLEISGSGSEEIRSRPIAVTACLLSPGVSMMLFLVLAKNRNVKTHRNISLPAVVVGVKLGLLHEKSWLKIFREQGSEKVVRV